MNLPRKNPLEWSVFGVSLLLVLVVIGYLAYSALNMDGGLPDLQVTLDEPALQTGPASDQWVVPVSVHNRGNSTAEDVLVEVTLERDGQPVETAEITFPQVPYRSTRQGMLAFTEDPREGQLVARVVGFLNP